jgi:hypothetical protein
MDAFARWTGLAATILLAGCAATEPALEFGPLAGAETAARMPFLRDGVTTRPEGDARLGAPDASFEAGRTWIYTFVATQAGGLRQWQLPDPVNAPGPAGRERPPPTALVVKGWRSDPPDVTRPFELVISFGPDDRVTRHTLLLKPGLIQNP